MILDHKYRVRVSHTARSKSGADNQTRFARRVGRRKKWAVVAGAVLVLAVLAGGIILFSRREESKNILPEDDLVAMSLSGPSEGVTLQREGQPDFEPVEDKQDISNGMTIRTDQDGRAVIKVGSGADHLVFIRLDHDSRLKIRKALVTGVELELIGGDMWVYRSGGSLSLGVDAGPLNFQGKSLTSKNIYDVSRGTNRLIVNNLSGDLLVQGALIDGQQSGAAPVTLNHKKRLDLDLEGTLDGLNFEEQEITDKFKESDWYHYNREKDRAL